jgi:quinol monooxygenase YgiN
MLEEGSVANQFYCEMYQDQAALKHHRTMPHFEIWADKSPESLAEPAVRTIANIVISG